MHPYGLILPHYIVYVLGAGSTVYVTIFFFILFVTISNTSSVTGTDRDLIYAM